MKNNVPLLFENIIEYQGFFWFTEFRYNALYRMPKDGTEAEFMGIFPTCADKGRLFVQIKAYKDMLIFVPLAAASIIIYNIEKEEFTAVPISRPEGNFDEKIKYDGCSNFRTCEILDGYAYFFPTTYPAILKLDLESLKMEYLYEPISKIQVSNSDVMYFKNSLAVGDKVLLWCICANSLLEFDVATETFDVVYHEALDVLYTDAVISEKHIWLLPYYSDSTVRRILRSTKEAADVVIPQGILSGNYQFISGKIIGDELWLFPGTANSLLMINCDTLEVKENTKIKSRINFNSSYYCENSWKFFFSYVLEGFVYLYNYYSCTLLKYNLQNGQIFEYKITQAERFSERTQKNMISYCDGEWKASRVVNEDVRFRLLDYIDYLSKN